MFLFIVIASMKRVLSDEVHQIHINMHILTTIADSSFFKFFSSFLGGPNQYTSHQKALVMALRGFVFFSVRYPFCLPFEFCTAVSLSKPGWVLNTRIRGLQFVKIPD